MLPDPIPSLAFYTVGYQADPPLLRAGSTRALSAEEATESGELVLAYAQHYDCAFWLLDNRATPLGQPMSLRLWLREDYFPRVRELLDRPVSVAFLVTSYVRTQLDAVGYGTMEELYPNVGKVGWFTEEGTALAWLDQQR